MGEVNFNIEDVVDFLGIEKTKKGRTSRSFNAKCPFCHDNKYHLNVNTHKGVYKCVHCGTGGGTLDLFSRVYLGAPLSTLDGKEVYKTLLKCLGQGGEVYRTFKKIEEVPEEQTASDDVLDRAYTEFLSIFRLSKHHRENLIKRGLSEEAIRDNGYKTFGDLATLITSEVMNEFEKLRLAEKFKGHERTRYYKSYAALASFAIGRILRQKGLELKGVPGFFEFDGTWCAVIEEGMLIPTRNVFGKIVGLQIRKDRGEVRYKTFSSRGLPSGAEVGISRLHFPKNNPKLIGSKVYLTEGPLKADVAKFLIQDDKVYFIACQGVSNTTAISKCFTWLSKNGIEDVYNALDMDKLTNINVIDAVDKIAEQAVSKNIRLTNVFWDIDEVTNRLLEYGFKKEQIDKEPPKRLVLMLREETKRRNESSESVDKHWRKNKGIDDYLLARRRG